MAGSKRVSLRAGGILAVVLLCGTVLWFAVTKTRQNAGQHLVSSAPIDIAAAKRAKLNLALVQAVKKRDAAQVKSLLARGADPNARDNSAYKEWQKRRAEFVTAKNKEWQKQRAELAAAKNKATGAFIVPNIAPDYAYGAGARAYLGPTVLMIAAHQSDNATIEVLADAGADLNAHGVDYGAASVAATDRTVDLENWVTPLIETMFTVEVPAMKLVLKRGARVNAQDSEGLTALDWAYNMTPTSEPTPQRKQFLDKLFHVLREAGAKRSQDLKP